MFKTLALTILSCFQNRNKIKKIAQTWNFLAKPSGPTEFKSTNVKLTANNYSLTTVANRRWSNIFSLSPRHGRPNVDYVSNSHTNTSSTDNSNNNLTTSSTSSYETAIHRATVLHEEATRTGIGTISAALPAMLCGLPCNNVKLNTQNTQAMANDTKHLVDDNVEQRIATANIGTEISCNFNLPTRIVTSSIFISLHDHGRSGKWSFHFPFMFSNSFFYAFNGKWYQSYPQRLNFVSLM